MKLTTTIRFFIIALLVSLASGWLCTYFYQSTSPGTFEIHQFQKKLNEKEKTAAETARRLLTDCNRLWLYAISHGHASFNITTNISNSW